VADIHADLNQKSGFAVAVRYEEIHFPAFLAGRVEAISYVAGYCRDCHGASRLAMTM
jgi:hypothetical protein